MKKQHELVVEQKWAEVEKEKLRKYDEREVEKALKIKEKIKHQMDSVTKQFNEYKTKKIIEYQDQVVEGQIIKKQALEAIEKDRYNLYIILLYRQKELERKEKAKQIQAEFVQANLELNKHKEIVKERNREEERNRQDFANAKEQLLNIKKQKEKELFQNKQMIRQRLIDKQVENLKNVKNKEDQILDKQMKEVEDKKKKEFEEKMRRLNMMKQQIDEHSAMVIKMKRDNVLKEKLDDKHFVDIYKERIHEMVINKIIYQFLIIRNKMRLMRKQILE